MFVRLLSLFAAGTLTVAQLINLPTTVEIDLVFPLNETYALIKPFPVIFIIQNAAAAWNFGFQFQWNITSIPDETSGRET